MTNNNIGKFQNLVTNFRVLMGNANKFVGFKISPAIVTAAKNAAALSEAGEVEKAYEELAPAKKGLEQLLRAFISNSPKHFTNLLPRLADEVDEDLVLRVKKAIGIYADNVAKTPGWNDSAVLYASLAHCFVLAQREQSSAEC